MIVARVVRPTWRVEREIVWENDDDTRTQRVVRTFLTEKSAYLCAARWRIFARRDELGEPCKLCKEVREPGENDLDFVSVVHCRYHDPEAFARLARRLARWLRFQDRRTEARDG